MAYFKGFVRKSREIQTVFSKPDDKLDVIQSHFLITSEKAGISKVQEIFRLNNARVEKDCVSGLNQARISSDGVRVLKTLSDYVRSGFIISLWTM